MKIVSNADPENAVPVAPDYENMYHKLFNAMNDAVELLIKAMRECEEQYINSVAVSEEEPEQQA